jgi:putative endonuclease
MFHVYVPLSGKTGRRYVGSTDNVERRFAQHNAGQSKSTRHGVPWQLIHVEPFNTRAEAVRRERYYKSGKGRDELEAIVG